MSYNEDKLELPVSKLCRRIRTRDCLLTSHEDILKWFYKVARSRPDAAWNIEPAVRISPDLRKEFEAYPNIEKFLVPHYWKKVGHNRYGYLGGRLLIVDIKLTGLTLAVDEEYI